MQDYHVKLNAYLWLVILEFKVIPIILFVWLLCLQFSLGGNPSLLLLCCGCSLPIKVPFKLSSNISKILHGTIIPFLQKQGGLRVSSITFLEFSFFPKKKEQLKDKLLTTNYYPKKEISTPLWHCLKVWPTPDCMLTYGFISSSLLLFYFCFPPCLLTSKLIFSYHMYLCR